MMNLKNNAMVLALIFMAMLSMHLKIKYEDLKDGIKYESKEVEKQINEIFKKDSLCQVWVNDTATRTAFKHWYKKQINKK